MPPTSHTILSGRQHYVAVCFRGLEPQLLAELRQVPGVKIRERDVGEGEISFRFGGAWQVLHQLRVATEIYWRNRYTVPRPKSLLGDQQFRQLVHQIDTVCQQCRESGDTVETFSLSMAGRGSAVIQRLVDQIERATGLAIVTDGVGDLALRLRPAKENYKKVWDLLLRTSARPLATRTWRRFDYPGAINGTIAAALLQMAEIDRSDRLLNLMSGSGTLLAELATAPVQPAVAIGGELLMAPLLGARENLAAAAGTAALLRCDGVAAPFADRSFDLVLADLPWGQLIGTHTEVESLYPLFFAEAFRLLKPAGRLGMITTAQQITEGIIKKEAQKWEMIKMVRVEGDKVSPTLYLLQTLPS